MLLDLVGGETELLDLVGGEAAELLDFVLSACASYVEYMDLLLYIMLVSAASNSF